MLNRKILAMFSALVLLLVSSQSGLADSSYQVKSADNLSKIAAKQYAGSGLTKSQILVGIYASNPKSFKNGNINKLNKGQKLILPSAYKIDQISPQEADLVLSSRKTLKKKKTKKRKTAKRKVKAKAKRRKKTTKTTSKKAASANLAKQKKNAQKIDRLQKEGNDLRKRLDGLLAEKTSSDKKLKELEGALRSALTKTAVVTSTAVAVVSSGENSAQASQDDTLLVANRANEQLREKNEILEQQLQDTKKEIASNSQIKLEEQQASQDAKLTNVNSMLSSDQLEKEQDEKTVAGATETNTVDLKEIKTTSTKQSQESGMNTFDTSNKYVQWGLLSLLLLPLIWVTRRFFLKKKAESEWVAPRDASGFLEREDGLVDSLYQEAPRDLSIKLNLAVSYIDSGEINGAIELLNEVMQEGNDEQRIQAQELMERI